MKKLIFGLFAIVLFNSFSFGQTFKGENKTSFIEASTIKSEVNSIIAEVKITLKETKETLPSFIYKFVSDSKSDIRVDLEKKSDVINGVFIIEVDKQILYRAKVVNSKLQEAETFEYVGTSILGKKYPCTIKGNFECAVDRVNEMNWFDSAVCMATAPECLAQIHISCWVDCGKK
jgi:hypothetical protein